MDNSFLETVFEKVIAQKDLNHGEIPSPRAANNILVFQAHTKQKSHPGLVVHMISLVPHSLSNSQYKIQKCFLNPAVQYILNN